jgi:predicted nucleic acid-binding Zn ribbon protein
MPTYVYETIPQTAAEQPLRFELRQGMTEKALTQHPETSVPVRRIIIGGTGMAGVKSHIAEAAKRGSCGTGTGLY